MQLVAGLDEVEDDIYVLSLCALISVIPRLCVQRRSRPVASGNGSTVTLHDGSIEESFQRNPAISTNLSQEPVTLDTSETSIGETQAASAGAVKTVRKKISLQSVSSPSAIGEKAPALHRKTSIVLLPAESSERAALPPRARRRSKPVASGPSDKLSAGSPGTSTTLAPVAEHRFTPQLLVESMIIPHTLNLCVTDEIPMTMKWMIMDALVALWKALSVMEGTNKVIAKCSHTREYLLFTCYLGFL